MTAANFLSRDEDAGQRRRRAVSLVLVVIVHALLLLMLLRLAPPFEPRRQETPITIVPVRPPETADQLKTHSARAQKASGGAPTKRAAAPAAARPTPQTSQTAEPWVINPDLAKFDLRKVPANPQPSAVASANDAKPSEEKNNDDVIGTGPGGQELWLFRGFAREPTGAEIFPYLPKDHDETGHEVFKRVGWGSIACKIVTGNRLEDCEELAETPGSGFSRALRQMAWQFRVLPPKRNGEVVYNTWVNLCFTFEEGGIAPKKANRECAGPWRGVMGKKGGAALVGPSPGGLVGPSPGGP